MDALAFMAAPPAQLPWVVVVTGKQRLLKRLVLQRIEALVAPDPNHVERSVWSGASASWGAVRDELDTLSFTATQRLVIVDDADEFVSRFRDKLEKYQAHPSRNGHLVLVVDSWPKTTRLAKQIPESATVLCDGPRPADLPRWAVKWAKETHDAALDLDAARELVQLVGTDLGILDQEIAKLAAYVGSGKKIDTVAVDRLVGHSRHESTFAMLDALAAGNLSQALGLLHMLFDQGEEPIAILGGISWQVRKMVQVARLQSEGVAFDAAVARAQFPPFKKDALRQHLRLLGPRVFDALDWLLEADSGMKSSDHLPARLLLERLVVLLGRADAAATR
jgi:DNA polymerase-3 subunit delta